jgi:hypothetical protein
MSDKNISALERHLAFCKKDFERLKEAGAKDEHLKSEKEMIDFLEKQINQIKQKQS